MSNTRSILLGLFSASLLCFASPLLHAETVADTTAAVSVPVEDIDALSKSANAALDAKDWPQALKLLDRYLTLKPDNANLHRRRGNVLLELGRNAEAITAYRKAAELVPKDANGWNGLCWTYLTLNRPLDARSFCEKAVSLDNANYAALVNLGHSFLLAGDTKTAHHWYLETLPNIDSEDVLKQGPLADFDLFISKGWQIKESRKAKAWFEKEGKSWLKRSAPVNKLLADANAADRRTDFALSITLREQHLPLLIALVGKDHPRVAMARKALSGTRFLNEIFNPPSKIADQLFAQADYAEALPIYRQVLAAREKENGPDSVFVGASLDDVAKTLRKLGQYAEAEPFYIRALAIFEKTNGPEQTATGARLNNLAELYQTMGQYARAEPLLIRALAIAENAQGPDHPSTGTGLNNLASLYKDMGQYARAEPLYIRALAISEKTNGPEHPSTGISLNNLAELYQTMGQYARAEPLCIRALAIFEKAKGPEHPDTGTSLNNLALLYQAMGLYARAEPLLMRALAVSEKAVGSEHPSTGISLNNLAGLYCDASQYARAEPLYIRALAISEKTNGPEHPSTGISLNNLAGLYQTMGQNARAEPLYIRALAISEKTNGPEHPDTGRSLNNLANLYRNMGQNTRAEPLFIRAIAITEKASGLEHPSTGASLNNLAALYQAMGQYARAEPLFIRARAIAEKAQGPEHPETGIRIHNLAKLYKAMNQPTRAEPLYLRAWRIGGISGRPELSWTVQGSLRGFYAKPHPDLAIWYGKQAVNTLQSVRANNTGLDKETQKSFLQKNEETYKKLADLLFAQGRLMEGQQVLAMLKEAEYFDFVQRNSDADPRKTQASFNSREKPWAERYETISGQLAALAKEREALIKKAQLGLTPEEQSRKAVLDANLADARTTFDAFAVELKREFAQSESVARTQADRQEASGEKSISNQHALGDLGHGAVTLHYLMTDKRLWILLTTPSVQLKRESAISEAELNKQIGAYREAIARRDPKVKELGKALYDIIIAPVADDLKQAEAQTLMLSLDGGLRYLPMAALYDGEQYLAQRYRLAIYTAAATSKLNVQPKANWDLAGFGLTRAVTVGEQSFNALSSVKGELEGIKQDMNGSIKLDYDFTAKSLEGGLESGSAVVHLASHFVFKPGNETNSFLLMGDGNPLSLAAVRNYTFNNVDLLTLSACETAVGGGKDANGREVESFGVLAQKQGAKAVIATLWPVDDQSTGQFMQLFYGFHQKNPGMTKAEAIQKAQLAFIEGRIGPALSEVSRGGVRHADGSKAAAAVTSTDHPYYWAPFILMGNWL